MRGMRYELKYMLTPVQCELLRARLKWVMERDAHACASGDYFIRSIYFDSPDRVALREKVSGVDQRRKYRIRFYNGDVSHCMLECKEKQGTRIRKVSQELRREQVEELLGIQRICPGRSQEKNVERGRESRIVKPEETNLYETLSLLAQSRGFAPVVTVDYVREAYVLPLSDLRVTFDKEIAWGTVEECLTRERYLSCVYGDMTVLEVKYNTFLPEHISAILGSVAPVQTAASKYVACVEAQFAAVGY